MCRLLAICSSESTDFKIVLREAPRSLAALSREHRDGWGIAVFDASLAAWTIDKGILCAGEDERFHSLAVGASGNLMVSHVRRRTVGEISLANTHPFRRARWVFAHNGTITDVSWLRAHASPVRQSEVEGQTDSELFFAWLLTMMDDAGVTGEPASARTDRAIETAARRAREQSSSAALNFVLSDGITTYAHCFGRSMFLLERNPEDAVRERRTSREGVVVETPWSQRRSAVFVASERVTDEPWQNVDDGMLLRIERAPMPEWRLVAA